MTIRTFLPGDEAVQVRIYNEAAGDLPKFKPATLDEIRRRCRAPEFDPGTRFFALADNEPVGYAGFQANGRVSFPWCRKGHETKAEALFEAVLQTLRLRGFRKAFAAYRADWPVQQEFFATQRFRKAREMVGYVLDIGDMPTPAARRGSAISPLTKRDIPALLSIAPEALRTNSAPDLERHLLQNPYYPPSALFVLRDRGTGNPQGAGILVTAAEFADPKQVDAGMPCFRLGAFGTEGMQVKRINGLFSFLAKPADANPIGLELLEHAASLLRSTNVEFLAAQVPSDVPHLLRFYENHFRRQGSFPVLEREV